MSDTFKPDSELDTKEEDTMAVLAKPCNVTFEVSSKKFQAFTEKDTKSAFKEAMNKFEKRKKKAK